MVMDTVWTLYKLYYFVFVNLCCRYIYIVKKICVMVVLHLMFQVIGKKQMKKHGGAYGH